MEFPQGHRAAAVLSGRRRERDLKNGRRIRPPDQPRGSFMWMMDLEGSASERLEKIIKFWKGKHDNWKQPSQYIKSFKVLLRLYNVRNLSSNAEEALRRLFPQPNAVRFQDITKPGMFVKIFKCYWPESKFGMEGKGQTAARAKNTAAFGALRQVLGQDLSEYIEICKTDNYVGIGTDTLKNELSKEFPWLKGMLNLFPATNSSSDQKVSDSVNGTSSNTPVPCPSIPEPAGASQEPKESATTKASPVTQNSLIGVQRTVDFDSSILAWDPVKWKGLSKQEREDKMFQFWSKTSFHHIPKTFNLFGERNITTTNCVRGLALLFLGGEKMLDWLACGHDKGIRVRCKWRDSEGKWTEPVTGFGTTYEIAQNDAAKKVLKIILGDENFKVLEHIARPFFVEGDDKDKVDLAGLRKRLIESFTRSPNGDKSSEKVQISKESPPELVSKSSTVTTVPSGDKSSEKVQVSKTLPEQARKSSTFSGVPSVDKSSETTQVSKETPREQVSKSSTVTTIPSDDKSGEKVQVSKDTPPVQVSKSSTVTTVPDGDKCIQKDVVSKDMLSQEVRKSSTMKTTAADVGTVATAESRVVGSTGNPAQTEPSTSATSTPQTTVDTKSTAQQTAKSATCPVATLSDQQTSQKLTQGTSGNKNLSARACDVQPSEKDPSPAVNKQSDKTTHVIPSNGAPNPVLVKNNSTKKSTESKQSAGSVTSSPKVHDQSKNPVSKHPNCVASATAVEVDSTKSTSSSTPAQVSVQALKQPEPPASKSSSKSKQSSSSVLSTRTVISSTKPNDSTTKMTEKKSNSKTSTTKESSLARKPAAPTKVVQKKRPVEHISPGKSADRTRKDGSVVDSAAVTSLPSGAKDANPGKDKKSHAPAKTSSSSSVPKSSSALKPVNSEKSKTKSSQTSSEDVPRPAVASVQPVTRPPKRKSTSTESSSSHKASRKPSSSQSTATTRTSDPPGPNSAPSQPATTSSSTVPVVASAPVASVRPTRPETSNDEAQKIAQHTKNSLTKQTADPLTEYFSTTDDGSLKISPWLSTYLKDLEVIDPAQEAKMISDLRNLDFVQNDATKDPPFLPFSKILAYEYPQEAHEALRLLFEDRQESQPEYKSVKYVLAEVTIGTEVFMALGETEEEAQENAAQEALRVLQERDTDSASSD